MKNHPFYSKKEVCLCEGELRYLVSRACGLGVAMVSHPGEFAAAETDSLIQEWRMEWKEEVVHELDKD